MDERRAALLKSLIDDLNSKSNDAFFNELVEAGIIFDDVSDSATITCDANNVKLNGSLSYDYTIKSTELLCA